MVESASPSNLLPTLGRFGRLTPHPQLLAQPMLAAYLQVRLVAAAVLGAAALVLGLGLGWWGGWVVAVLAALVAIHAIRQLGTPTPAPFHALLVDTTFAGACLVAVGVPLVSAAFAVWLVVVITLWSPSRLSQIAAYVYLAVWVVASLLIPAPEGMQVPSEHEFLVGWLGTVIVAAMAAALVSLARRRIDQVETQRTHVVGTVAHELRNALTGVMGASSMLRDEPELWSGEEATDLIRMVAGGAEEATEIIDDLLTLSRIERGVLAVDREQFDLAAEVAEALDRIRQTSGVEAELEAEPGAVVADRLRVRQVLRNLVSNAAKYGGERVRVVVTYGKEAGVLAVEDDGAGIPVDLEGRIFEPFRHGGTSRQRESVGLGLWISRQLAQAMGGELAYGRQDGWTRFELMLLAAPAGQGDGSGAEAGPGPAAGA